MKDHRRYALVTRKIFQPLQDKRVVVGQNVLLECQVEAHPDPVVKWLKDDHDVTQCPDYEVPTNFFFYCFVEYSAIFCNAEFVANC